MKVAFTVATANFFAQAITLANSLLAHNPDYIVIVALLDKIDEIRDVPLSKQVQVIPIDEMNIYCFEEMVEKYNIFELCNAMKPFCAEYIFKTYDDVDFILYLDNDIMVYNKFTEIENLISNHSIIISPHIYSSPPLDGKVLDETDFLNVGIYNGGFFVIANDVTSRAFLEWWKERMRTLCFVNLAKGLFADQIWLNFVPLYFQNVKIIESLGYNMATWNLHERTLTLQDDGSYYVCEKYPLVFFHFSGFDIMNPEVMSKFQNRYDFESRPDIKPLFEKYKDALLNNDYLNISKVASYYNRPVKQADSEASQPIQQYTIFRRIIEFAKQKLLS